MISGRERGERRRAVDRQKAVRIVLDDRDAEAARDRDDFSSSRRRDRVGGRIEQRRIEIKRPRRQTLAGVGKSLGIDALVVHGQSDVSQAQLRGNRTRAGVGERFRKHDVASLGQHAEDAEQGGMRARRDEQPILLRSEHAVPQPVRSRILVGLNAAKTLIAHQIDQVAAKRFQTVLHPVEQFGIIRLGREIHRQIDDFRMTRNWTVPPFRRRAHESALSDPRFDQAAPLGLDIAARHRREIDIETAGELALWRQPIRGSELAVADVLGDRIGDGEIARLAQSRQDAAPIRPCSRSVLAMLH